MLTLISGDLFTVVVLSSTVWRKGELLHYTKHWCWGLTREAQGLRSFQVLYQFYIDFFCKLILLFIFGIMIDIGSLCPLGCHRH